VNQVNDKSQASLRDQGLMSENEVAYTKGDLLVVVDVVTEQKRVLGSASKFLTESVERRILKG